jgi:septal ring-binding cell division protein DamX
VQLVVLRQRHDHLEGGWWCSEGAVRAAGQQAMRQCVAVCGVCWCARLLASTACVHSLPLLPSPRHNTHTAPAAAASRRPAAAAPRPSQCLTGLGRPWRRRCRCRRCRCRRCRRAAAAAAPPAAAQTAPATAAWPAAAPAAAAAAAAPGRRRCCCARRVLRRSRCCCPPWRAG